MLFSNLIVAFAFTGLVAAVPRRSNSNVSSNGKCGSNGMTCLGSPTGDCCSQYGYCGTSAAYCSTGCQSAHGTCWSNVKSVQSSKANTQPSKPVTSSSQSSSTANLPVSKNSRCGTSGNHATCTGSGAGDCCSVYGKIHGRFSFWLLI